MNYKKIGNYIQEKRKEKGLTQKDLAKKLYLTDKAISKWERGLGCPDISVLEKLSAILEISILSILNGEDTTEKEIDKAIIETINYSKTQEKTNFKIQATNFMLLLIFSIIAFLIHSNIAHIIYLNNINKVSIEYDGVKDSIELVQKIEDNINKIKLSKLKYSEEDKAYILDMINDSYEMIIINDFYNLKEQRVFSLKEIYDNANKSKILSNIALVRKIDEYDEDDFIKVDSYIDLTLLRMFNKQNIFRTINSLDVYNSPFDFKSFNTQHIDSLILQLDFKMEVKALYYLTEIALIIGEIHE